MNEPSLEPENISKTKAFFLELRAPFLTGSVTPVFLGTAIAWALTGVFIIDVFFLTVIAGVCLHIGANISNDYFDHSEDHTGSDDINKGFIRPFTGGSRMIQLGILTPREVLVEAFIFFGIAGIIGVYLTFTRGFIILILGIIGAGSGFFYTAPPFYFVKRGLGEAFIGLNFGVLMVLGSYYVQALDISWEPIIASVPTALLIAGVLYINEFPDFIADRDSGKRTIVVRLGLRRASKGYAAIITVTFAWVVIMSLLSFIILESLLALTLLPLGYVGVRTALNHYDDSLRMIPANAATIVLHMLMTLYLTVAYILKGLDLDVLLIGIIGVVMFVIVGTQYRKLTRPHPNMA